MQGFCSSVVRASNFESDGAGSIPAAVTSFLSFYYVLFIVYRWSGADRNYVLKMVGCQNNFRADIPAMGRPLIVIFLEHE